MTKLHDALAIRARRKPRFARQDSHKKVEVGTSYRRPKGLQSKMRLRLKSYSRMIAQGFRSPKLVRGLSTTGLIQVYVSTLPQLDVLTKAHGAIINGTVGDKRREQLLTRAHERGITILNHDVPATLERIKKRRAKASTPKKPVASPVVAVAPEPVSTPEEHEEHEKAEKEKILTKKV